MTLEAEILEKDKKKKKKKRAKHHISCFTLVCTKSPYDIY